MRSLKKRLTPSFALAVFALLVALGGTGYAGKMITTRDIKNGTIKTEDISSAAISDLKAHEYAYIYNLTAQTVLLEADVPFDSNGSLTPAVSHTAGTSSVTFNQAGNYEVQYSVSANEPNQFALFLNSVAVPGSIYGSGAGTQQNTGQAVVTAAAGDVLTLRNHTSAAAVTLATVVGGTQANVNASLMITKLS